MSNTVILRNQGFRILKPTSPFDFDGTVFRPDHFPSRDADWKPGVYWQTIRWKRKNYGVKLRDVGSLHRPKIRVSLFARKKPSASTFEEILGEIR